MPKTVRLRLTLDVEYELNGESVERMKAYLNEIGPRAANTGLMTGDTAAEVEEWASNVKVLSV
jgi:hypothetical protein